MSNETIFGYGLIPMTPEREAELEALGQEYNQKRQAARGGMLTAIPTVVDLAPQFPPIRSQGDYGTCVAFASAAILDYWDGKLSGRGSGTIVRSPLHLYYPNTKSEGMSADEAMRNAALRGACAEAERPYPTASQEYKFSEPITLKQQVSGDFWNHASPYPLVKPYTSRSSNDEIIQGIKEHLANGMPMLMELTTKTCFDYPGEGGVITPSPSDVSGAGHAVVIVGYNDNTGMFKLRNSWGTSWGSSGHGYIRYNDLFSLTGSGFYANDYYNHTCYDDGGTLMNPYVAQQEGTIITIANFKKNHYRFIRFVASRTGSHVFTASTNSFELTVMTEDYNTVVAPKAAKTVTANLVSGQAYIIQIYCSTSLSVIDGATVTIGSGSSGGGSTPGDSFANAIVVSGTSANGNLVDTKDLFFKYTATNAGSYTFTTSSSFDAYMELIDSNQLTVLGKDDDSAGSSQPKITSLLQAGQLVYAKVYGYSHGAGKYGPVTLTITPPAGGTAPGTCSLAVGSPTTNSLTLSYSATGATTYDIYRNGSLIVSGRTATNYTDTGLSAKTDYTYYVIARNAYGSSQSSNVTQKTAGAAPGACSLTVGSPTTSSLTLNYSATGATSYDIYRGSTKIQTGRTSTSYTDTGLAANTSYTYYVIARNDYGTTTSSSKQSTTLPAAGPKPVTISEGFEGSSDAFKLTGDWADSKNEASTGKWSRRSKTISHKDYSTMQFIEEIPSNYAQPPTLMFDYLVSSESTYDYLEVLVNGVSKLKASGETGWVRDYTVALGTGKQTVTFTYTKDGSTSKGQDCAYVDNIRVSY